MRRNLIYIIISLLGWLFILPGCTDEVMPGSRYEVKEGVPVSVTLKTLWQQLKVVLQMRRKRR